MVEIVPVESEFAIVGFLQRVIVWSSLHTFCIKIIGTFTTTPCGLKGEQKSQLGISISRARLVFKESDEYQCKPMRGGSKRTGPLAKHMG